MKKPTKTVEELKAMIRREAGRDMTVTIKSRPDGGWVFATGHWMPDGGSAALAHAAGHALMARYDIKPN
ncbi:hypothetical protein AAIH70_11560 [Neorhizobium sp. BT27B]|uniref:hypothetical protein n=1 Tax=Neorhizobium sp. BT27B TaxID=3142625 RepID=UPI003D2A089F